VTTLCRRQTPANNIWRKKLYRELKLRQWIKQGVALRQFEGLLRQRQNSDSKRIIAPQVYHFSSAAGNGERQSIFGVSCVLFYSDDWVLRHIIRISVYFRLPVPFPQETQRYAELSGVVVVDGAHHTIHYPSSSHCYVFAHFLHRALLFRPGGGHLLYELESFLPFIGFRVVAYHLQIIFQHHIHGKLVATGTQHERPGILCSEFWRRYARKPPRW